MKLSYTFRRCSSSPEAHVRWSVCVKRHHIMTPDMDSRRLRAAIGSSHVIQLRRNSELYGCGLHHAESGERDSDVRLRTVGHGRLLGLRRSTGCYFWSSAEMYSSAHDATHLLFDEHPRYAGKPHQVSSPGHTGSGSFQSRSGLGV